MCYKMSEPTIPLKMYAVNSKLSGRIKHAPNRGYHFVSPLPPFSLRGTGPLPVPENLPFLWEVLLLLQDHLYESIVFSPTGQLGGEPWREMVDLNSVHVWFSLKWFRKCLRYAVTNFSSETMVFFMHWHLPYFGWESFWHACAALKKAGLFLMLWSCTAAAAAAAVLKLFRIHFSCESWLAFLILEAWSPPAISCGSFFCRKKALPTGKCIFL